MTNSSSTSRSSSSTINERSTLCLYRTPTASTGIPDIFIQPSVAGRSIISLENGNTCENVCVSLPVDYICRICHGGNSFEDLLTPCKCKGSIALAHLKCLETWLNSSDRNECELCQYHFRVIREPEFSILMSIWTFLRHPGALANELIIDLITFLVYTPSTVTSTYMLMLLCETLAKSPLKERRTILSHCMALTAIFGIAAINFTYTSWLALCLEKYVDLWREFYRKHSSIKVVLSKSKLHQINNLQRANMDLFESEEF